jgi:hypothetical protein
MILRFEPLEGRELLSTTVVATGSSFGSKGASATTTQLPDLVGGSFDTPHSLDWGDTFHARGTVVNQGQGPVSVPFKVDFYASPTPGLSATTAVYLGEATVPAGLQPGTSAPIDQVVSLPNVPLAGVGGDNVIYVEMVADPQGSVAESNKANNYGLGQGYDLSTVTITPHLSSNLIGASLGVYPDAATWGSTVRVSAEIQNDAGGDAPATRARVVLTPTGYTPGGPADVTIGNLTVPAIPAQQATVVTQDITLPSFPPSGYTGITHYVLSVVQDADFVANPIAPHVANRGLGLDMVQFSVALPTDPNVSLGPRPDLTPSSVLAPSQPIGFGQTFQVTATIQNKGNLDSSDYRVRFLLVGSNGDLSQGLFLGDATVKGLKAGYAQDIVQTLKFPSRLPSGVTLNSSGRIAVEVDPENVIDESSKTNNTAVSNVVNLSLVKADGTSVPVTATTLTAAAKPVATTTPATTLKPTGTAPKTTNPVTPAGTKHKVANKGKLGKIATPGKHTLKHNLRVFPKHVSTYVHKLIKKL